ncbi:MAG: AarF/ABC1/UbiB kinase family protein [Myxococcota bacterium]|nr:AarF/ABC1/UbiB kinase family protein [Myxococcota bacterium]
MSKSSTGPTSRRRRFLKLAGMTAAVAGTYARDQITGVFTDEDTRARQKANRDARSGARIAKTLGELKGAAMKVGQLASVAKDILPDELTASLATLQRSAPPMEYGVIAEQIERELGRPPELLFARFDPIPFAAASIGQVHRAQTDDGREVVVKVQYPGVDESVDSDISHLKLALRASGMLATRRAAFDAFFLELRDRMREEVDYTHEAQNVRWFKELHADDPHLIIPDVVGERSSGRILTLTYEPGDSLGELDPAVYDQECRNRIGERLLHMVFRQVFELHAVHADPNPANFAARPNGDVVLYDFGCVKVFPQEHAARYRDLMRSLRDGDEVRIRDAMVQVGIARPGADAREYRAFIDEFRASIGAIFFQDAVYDFGQTSSPETYLRMVGRALRNPRLFQPSAQILFTDRAQGGQLMNLVKMDCKVNLHRIYEQYLSLPQRGDDGFASRMARVPRRPPV